MANKAQTSSCPGNKLSLNRYVADDEEEEAAICEAESDLEVQQNPPQEKLDLLQLLASVGVENLTVEEADNVHQKFKRCLAKLKPQTKGERRYVLLQHPERS